MNIDVGIVRVPGPLGPYAEGFRDELARMGYTPLSAIVQMRLMARLSRWLAESDLSPSGLTTALMEVFFAERRAAGYHNSRTPRSVAPLVDYLRRLGVAPLATRPEPFTETERMVACYREYLTRERGLAASTVALNVRLVRPFLSERASSCDGRLDLQGLTAAEVHRFVTSFCRRRPRSGKRLVTALRSLLGFVHLAGMIDRPLAGAVPSPAGWTLAGLPKPLEPEAVAALLACCDAATATGRRDRAILTLLVRLGLRVGEVAALRLNDIDWRQGEISVQGKGNRHDVLPLPTDVGNAIVAYLRDGRPAAAQERTVFVRAQAPYRALTSGGVITVVTAAGRRAGLGPVAAHRLRHSTATAVLHAGGSLEEIGQLLRHLRPATSSIYAKVDLEALRALVRPWPGAA